LKTAFGVNAVLRARAGVMQQALARSPPSPQGA